MQGKKDQLSLEEQRDSAFRQGNYPDFYRLCNQTGYNEVLMRKSPCDSERIFYEMGRDLVEEGVEVPDTSGRDIFKQKLFSDTRASSRRGFRRTKIPASTYQTLYERVQESDINPQDVFSDIEVKRGLIREVFGYRSLVARGGPILLEDCSGEKIGSTFRKMYSVAKKRLGK